MADSFDPTNVDLTSADPAQVVCFLTASENDYDGRLGVRISAVFVILILSTAATLFPVMAVRVPSIKVPLYALLFARYFGAGVIIATAFIHLLDPAYEEIGPASCVGLTGGWASYSWPPAIAMSTVMLTFLIDVIAEYYVERKFGMAHVHVDTEKAVARSHNFLHSADQEDRDGALGPAGGSPDIESTPETHRATNDGELEAKQPAHMANLGDADETGDATDKTSTMERAFHEQIAAFLVLEFGVIFHSVIIGLNLGVAGAEFTTLYVVIVFHQSFEGLGLGARLCAIPIPNRWSFLPWALGVMYGLTTPLAIAIGIGLSTRYEGGSFTAQVVSGVLDSLSAGILIYTGLVELLARDFLFNPQRTRKIGRLVFMLVSLFLGVMIMALLGKWA